MHRIHLALATVGCSFLACGPALFAQAPARSAAKSGVSVTGALVTAIDDVEVPARDAGPVAEIAVQRGVEVKTGAVLGKIDDIDAELKHEAALAEMAVAEEQANSTAEITAAKHTAGAAEAEYLQSKALRENQKEAVSAQQLRRDLLQWQRAVAQVAVAEMEHRKNNKGVGVKAAMAKTAEHEIRKRVFTAPVDGVVVDIRKDVAEWVQPGDPVFRIVRMDKLRVEGYVNASEVHQDEIRDKAVRVIVHQPRGEKVELAGRIDFASPIIEANGEFRVHCDVKNQQVNGNWVISPGARADMVIDLTRTAPAIGMNVRKPAGR